MSAPPAPHAGTFEAAFAKQEAAPRSLTILFGATFRRINLKFYPSGSREDMLAGIRELMGTEQNATLRFRDAAGDAVLLSPTGMPDGSVLHVSIDHGTGYMPPPIHSSPVASPLSGPPKITIPAFSSIAPPTPTGSSSSTLQSSSHHPRRPSQQPAAPAADPDAATMASLIPRSHSVGSSLTTASRHGASSGAEWRRWAKTEGINVTNIGTRFRVAFQSAADEPWAAYTPALPTTGRHYFVVGFPGARPCCASLGVIPVSLSGHLPKHRCLIGDAMYPHMVALMGIGARGGAAYSGYGAAYNPDGIDVGVLFDMDRRMVVMVPHDDPLNASLAVRMDDIPVPLCFAVCSPRHAVSAVIRRCPVPACGVFAGPEARFVKSNRFVGWLNFCVRQ